MSDKTVAVVYEGGNHFTICTCEPGRGEHYDILERLQDQVAARACGDSWGLVDGECVRRA